MEGWICLYKKLINWEWYQDGNTCRLFIHLLLLANYEDKTWQGQLIKRGQLITSSEHLAKDLNLSRQQVRTAINKLKSTSEITTKSTNKYTLITIEKYEDYQAKTDKSNQQRNQQYDNQIYLIVILLVSLLVTFICFGLIIFVFFNGYKSIFVG